MNRFRQIVIETARAQQDRNGGIDHTMFSVLRRHPEITGMPLAAFHGAILALARERAIVLTTLDGRHGKLTSEDLTLALVCDDRRFHAYEIRR